MARFKVCKVNFSSYNPVLKSAGDVDDGSDALRILAKNCEFDKNELYVFMRDEVTGYVFSDKDLKSAVCSMIRSLFSSISDRTSVYEEACERLSIDFVSKHIGGFSLEQERVVLLQEAVKEFKSDYGLSIIKSVGSYNIFDMNYLEPIFSVFFELIFLQDLESISQGS